MASPFNVFRRNQKIWMAVLVGFSMFAFIVADSLNASNMPVFLGAILGAIGLWLLSNKGGMEGWMIAAVGGVVGAALGAFAPAWLSRDTVVFTDAGNLTHRQVAEIQEEQQTANQFVQTAFMMVRERTPEDERRMMRPARFEFVQVSNAASARENAVFTYLFGKEADNMGITLTDEAVREYIVEAAGGTLEPSEFSELLGQLQIGSGKLIDLLREQLRAREAYRLLSPVGSTGLGPSTPTPQQLWNDFKKLKAEATVAVATLPVEEFVSQVADPSDEELRRFFEQYKALRPAPDGTPGFRVPRKVQVAYLEILASTVGESVTPPTKEEVLAHYEANKARYQFSQQRPPAGSAAEGQRQPLEAPRPSEASGNGSSSTFQDPEAASESPSNSTPAAEGATPRQAPKPGTDGSGQAASGFAPEDLAYVAFQGDRSPPAVAPRPGTTNTQSTQGTPDNEDASAGDSSPGPSLPQLPPTGSAPPSQPGGATSQSGDAEPTPEVLAMIRRELMSQRLREAMDERQTQVHERVGTILQEEMSKISQPTDPQDEKQIAAYEAARAEAIQRVLKRMKAHAAEHDDLDYRVTEAMSGEELMNSEEYPVGQATRWRANQPAFGTNNPPLAQIFFQSSPDQPPVPINGKSPVNQSRFVALKVTDTPSRIPVFGEEGIPEQVAEAWKRVEARQLAEERARELVKTINESDKGLTEIAKNQSLTGQESGGEMAVEDVGPFTWRQRSSVPSQGMAMPAIQPTTLSELPAAGEEFMRTVFETTNVGKAGMAPSVDNEKYYLVQIKSRTSEEELETARSEFLKEDFFTDRMNPFTRRSMNPYRRLVMAEAMSVRQEWMRNFLDEHDFVTAETVEEEGQ